MSLAAPRALPTGVPDLSAALADVVDALTAAGIAAVVDMRDLNPPAVYVAAPQLAFDRLRGWTAVVDLWAVVPAAGRLQALSGLGPLLAQVIDVWPATAAYPADLPPLDGGDPMPAYRLTCPIRVC